MAHGDFAHIEFPADDLARARAFYEGALGWRFEGVPGLDDYLVYVTPSGLGGGVGLRGKTAADSILDYIQVDAIDEALGKIEALGGSVRQGRTEVPGQGWYAVATDTEGNELGLWEGLPG